ncbi:MAG: response regulator [Saprospiraceae bacterium]
MVSESIDVLIIDDDQDIQMMIQAILKFHGLSVKASSNSQMMNQLLNESVPKVILMDMLLFGMDGREICRELKSRRDIQDIPIIMMSNHPDAEITCRAAGADDFLVKPFEIMTLIAKVKGFL